MIRPRLFTQPWLRMVALWGAVSLVASVQRGTVTISSGTSNTATITAVDTSRTLLYHLGTNYNAAAVQDDIGFLRVALTNSTTVTASRNTSSANVGVASFEVVEYLPGVFKSIQRGTVVAGSTASITEVDPAKCSLTLLGFTVDSGSDLRNMPYVALTNGTTVTGTFVGDGAAVTTAGFQIAEHW